jgi:hypothetical protein
MQQNALKKPSMLGSRIFSFTSASCWWLWEMWISWFGEGDRSIIYGGYSLTGRTHCQGRCRQWHVIIMCNHTRSCHFNSSQLLQLL